MIDAKNKADVAASTIRALFDAYRDRRRGDAETLIADNFRFTSPYDDGIDRTTYFARCWPNGDRIVAFEIEKLIADHGGGFVTYRCTTNDGTAFRNTEYLTVRHGQVANVDVYFGASYRDGKFVKP
jgi:hypothetical protein